MSDLTSLSFLHKSMFAKKIETNLDGITCWGVKKEEVSLTLQQSSITNLLSELKIFRYKETKCCKEFVSYRKRLHYN